MLKITAATKDVAPIDGNKDSRPIRCLYLVKNLVCLLEELWVEVIRFLVKNKVVNTVFSIVNESHLTQTSFL